MSIALTTKLPRLPTTTCRSQRPEELRFHVLLLAGAIVLGATLQVCGPPWARSIFEQVRLDSLSGMAALLLALFTSMVAHELGHLSAALFLNFEILGGAIGPLRFELWPRKVTFRFTRSAWFGGSISAVPREIQNVWRGRMLVVVAAGPLSSSLFLLAAILVAPSFHEQSWLTTFWSSCAEVNFFVVILGLIPNTQQAAVRNDAALFVSLWRSDADALDLYMCHQATELRLRGIRPEDYPEPLLLELARFRGTPYTTLMVARRIAEWATDCSLLALAEEWNRLVATAAAACSPRLANCALAEAACFDVTFRGDLRSARFKFANIEFENLSPPWLAERAWAARLVACDLANCAPAHILRARYQLPLGIPYYDYERSLLAKLHAQVIAHRNGGIRNPNWPGM